MPAALLPRPAPLALQRRGARGDEVLDVEALLLAHVQPDAGPAAEAALVAETIAVACLGDRHLWQDLGLGSRAELSALLRRWFPSLVQRNAGDMKWKKFLYRELCARAEILVCKAPSCAACNDRPACFGPEL